VAETQNKLSVAPDDVVRTPAEGEANSRPPLLVLDPLEEFLDRQALGVGEGSLEVEPVGEGHSNVTYLLRRGDSELILRRPPRPPLPPSAHDVLREACCRPCTATPGSPGCWGCAPTSR